MKPPRDVDSAAAVRRLRSLLFAIGAGFILGAFAGWKFSLETGTNLVLSAFVGMVLCAVLIYAISNAVTEGSGTLISKIHNPSGSSTPTLRDYSYAQSLVARGLYEDAVAAFEAAAAEHPEDPEPYLRLARLHRDRLGDYEEALAWLRRARTQSAIDAGRELVATEEIIEIYTKKVGTPRRHSRAGSDRRPISRDHARGSGRSRTESAPPRAGARTRHHVRYGDRMNRNK